MSRPAEAFETFVLGGFRSLSFFRVTMKANFAIGLQEAYEEFKRVLLALMYDKDDENSPVAEEVLLSYFG